MKYRVQTRADGSVSIPTAKRGHALLGDAILNKGSAFTVEERHTFGLDGLLPAQVTDRDTQVARAMEHIQRKGDNPLEQYIGLAALQDRNETLFHQLLAAHTAELVPIVYTPTVGEAALQFSHIFRRGRGLWITPEHRGRISEVLGNARNEDVRLIVATDNQRILGLGDQGAGGMVIPIGKLALYSMAAGIHPALTLPVSLDVGTDNEERLADPLYVGWRRRRLRGAEYDELIEEFVEAVATRFPDALLQWEDFKKANAFRLLAKYRYRLPSFNDDIQGTGAVAAAGVLTASRLNHCKIADQRVLIAGAGAAGIGIANQLQHAMAAAGMSGDDVHLSLVVVDSMGLVTDARPDLEDHKAPFAWPESLARSEGLQDGASLHEVAARLRPSVLVGTTGEAALFDRELIESLSEDVDHPVVMPLSNPTSKCEAAPADVVQWSGGRAVIATGSPFPPVVYGGKEMQVGQCNNVLVFPGVGLGAIAIGARTVTDEMFDAASRALADAVDEEDLAAGALYPPITELRSITRGVAEAVARCGAQRLSEHEVAAAIDEHRWSLDYPRLIPI